MKEVQCREKIHPGMKEDRQRKQREMFFVPAGVKNQDGRADMEQDRKYPLDEGDTQIRE